MSNGEIILPGAFDGALPMREDITILPATPVPRDKQRLGWVVFEEVGEAIINSYAIDRIVVGNQTQEDIKRALEEYMRKYAR